MPPLANETREIRPAAPDDVIRGLLALPLAQILALETGNLYQGAGRDGAYLVAAAVRGSVTVATHSQYAVLEAGEAVVVGAEETYSIHAVSDSLCMMMVLQGELVGRLLRERLENGCAVFARGAAVVRETVMAMAVLEEENPPVSGEMASAYSYTLLMKLRTLPAEEKSGFPSLVESAIAIIQEEFPYLEGLDELAQRLEVSKAHLIRSFTQKTGVSPGKYITRVKIEYAKLLLQDEGSSISYVAEASGFANANYFAKVFRRETGMSPSEYLESAPKRKETKCRIPGGPVLW